MILIVPPSKYASLAAMQTAGGRTSLANPKGKDPASNKSSSPAASATPGAPSFNSTAAPTPGAPTAKFAEFVPIQAAPPVSATDMIARAKRKMLGIGHDFATGLADHLNEEAQDLNRVRSIEPHRAVLGPNDSDKTLVR